MESKKLIVWDDFEEVLRDVYDNLVSFQEIYECDLDDYDYYHRWEDIKGDIGKIELAKGHILEAVKLINRISFGR